MESVATKDTAWATVRDWRGHRWTALAVRLYLAGIFAWAWYPKITDTDLFALQISAYEILPLWMVAPVAYILPWIELITALLLAGGIAVRAAAAAVAGMLLVFMMAMAIAMANGIELSCGCFGAGSDAVGSSMLWRDAGWLVLASYVLVFDRKPIGAQTLL